MAAPDFRGVAAAALRNAHDLVATWLPNGRAEGNEWVAANPRRPSSDGGGAFRVNLHSGQWADFAGDGKGGDLVSLYAYLHACGQAEACREVAKQCGVPGDVVAGAAARGRPAAAPAKRDGEQVFPAPADAPPFEPALQHYRLGKPTRFWPYRAADGRVLMVVARYAAPTPEDPTAKEIMPFTLWRLPSGNLLWRSGALPKPWPLYHLDQFAQHPLAPVVVAEGEKAADAAEALLPGHVGTTAPSGWQKAPLADWSPLAGRRVVIWPDHDWQGLGYGVQARDMIRAAGAASVTAVSYAWAVKALAALRGGTAA
jgi:putative DNA primase/helicase